VAPAETLTKRLYSAAAIAWSLALFGVLLLTPPAVRALVSPWQVLGAASAPRWVTLFRWCNAAAEGRLFRAVRSLPAGSARQVAEAVAAAASAHAMPSPEPPPLDVLAFIGAARTA
jgi:hypothetical protein